MTTKAEFREKTRNLLNESVADLTLAERLAIVRQCMIEVQEEAGHDEANKGKSWTDEELLIVLQHAPTKENCLMLARGFRRGYGSIEQIFRWAAASGPDVETKRPDDAFIQQD